MLDSHINVVLHEDWEVEFERIFELCQRTNQLNFTKKRSNAEELKKEFLCAKRKGYIEIYDKYGNYGNVGYFIFDANEHLSHFVFSCRVLNMDVEQYVYHSLGKPKVEISYPVASLLNAPLPNWINQKTGQKTAEKKEATSKILLKGSCDFRRMELYLQSGVEFEVPYVLNGKLIVYQTGISTIAMTLLFNAEEIAKYAEGVPFYSDKYYLDAPVDIIRKRCAGDSRLRKTMDEFLKNWLEDFEQYFKSFSLTKVLDTGDKDEMMVYREFMKMVGEI